MKCIKCGTVLKNTETICPGCGGKVEEIKTEENSININNNQTDENVSKVELTNNDIEIKEVEHKNKDVLPIDAKDHQKLDITPVKNNKLKLILIIAVSVIVLIIFSIFTYKFVNNYLNNLKESVTYKVSYGSYTFDVLNKYTYSTSNDEFVTFYDETNSWKAKINISIGNYGNLSNDYLKIKPIFENEGLIVKNVIKKKIDNRDYISVEMINNGKNQILLYTKLDNNNIITVLLVNKNYTFDYLYVDYIKEIIENINVNSNSSININELSLPNISDLIS